MGVSIAGLDLQSVDAFGATWDLLTLQGWGSPGSSIAVTQKDTDNGAWVDHEFAQARVLILTGTVFSTDASVVAAALRRLATAFAFTGATLTVPDFDTPRMATVFRQASLDVTDVTRFFKQWTVTVVAPDPRIYGTPLVVSTGLPSSSGGLTVPFTVPFSINSTVVTGQASLTNPGDIAGPVIMRISGPVVGPVITHVGTGAQLVFASSLTLGAGEFLLVDMEAKTVLAQGQSSRAQGVISRGWSLFEPGPNTWSFTAVSGSGLLQVTATPAWN